MTGDSGRELLAGDGAARLARFVGDLHAARVVDEHADEVLLRDGGAHHEDRAEQAEKDQGQRGDPQGREDEPVPHGGAAAACAAVGEDRRRDGQQHEGRRHVRTGRRHQTEIALLKDDRPVTEEQLEERLEHVSDPAGAPRGANEPLSGQSYNRDTEAPQTIVTKDDRARHRLQVLEKIM